MVDPNPTLQVVFLSIEKLANNLTNMGGFGLYSLAGFLIFLAVLETPDFPRWLRLIGLAKWGISIIATDLLIVVPSLAAGPFVESFMLYTTWVWGSACWLWNRN